MWKFFFDQNGYHRNTLSDICDKSNDMGANLEKYIRWIYLYLQMSILVTFSHNDKSNEFYLKNLFFFSKNEWWR